MIVVDETAVNHYYPSPLIQIRYGPLVTLSSPPAQTATYSNVMGGTQGGAFEMKGLRKILQVSWTAEKTN